MRDKGRRTREWNQALGMRVIEGNNFTDTAKQYHTSLTPAIAIDEYKADTQTGVYV
ncbi:hypothetical protein M3202_00130 [Alkalihalobacillus oceani]|uniref:Uncharacterized protein n=1 Tax=Halalkalibacter oceani TaxID=1653776 RepID=A0A9X2IL47_9BACI|nr:hypothetical protein [Halalkalibacter oceani]MCM3712474.1 hypothetical protein [Halalkalibacter oceani]